MTNKLEIFINEATEYKSELANAVKNKENMSAEEKEKIKKSFLEKVKGRENTLQEAITTVEKTNDPTKAEELKKLKADLDAFQKEYKTLLDEDQENKQIQTAEATAQTTTDLTNLGAEISNNQSIDITTLSGKSRPELWLTPGYISKIQEIILQTGAKHTTISENKLKDGIFGPAVKAGVETIQNYLNETYSSNLVPDGIPGENTLTALLSPVSETDTTSRLDKMLSEKPTFTKIFEIEKSSAIAPKETEEQKQAREKTEAIKTPLDIDGANKEIPQIIIEAKIKELKNKYPKQKDDDFIKERAIAIIRSQGKHTYFIYNEKKYWCEGDHYIPAIEISPEDKKRKELIYAKTQELKNKFPKFIEAQKKTDQYFAWKRAIAIIENGEKRKEYQKILKNRIENQKTTTPEKKENKKTTTSENVSEKSIIDTNILTIARKDIKNKLLNYINNNPIKFTGTNAQGYNKYYEENIRNIKDPAINIITYNNIQRVNILEDKGRTKYFIDLKPSDFIKKSTYEVNFNSILDVIKKDIIKKVDKEIENKEKEKLQKKYNTLESYLENQKFTINYLYTKEELKGKQAMFIRAFFEDFTNGIDFNNGDSEFLEKSKEIKVEFENDDWNKYGTWTLSIEDKFNTDGSSLNKEKIKQELRKIIDYKIQRVYPSYKPEQKSATTKTENKNQYGK